MQNKNIFSYWGILQNIFKNVLHKNTTLQKYNKIMLGYTFHQHLHGSNSKLTIIAVSNTILCCLQSTYYISISFIIISIIKNWLYITKTILKIPKNLNKT